MPHSPRGATAAIGWVLDLTGSYTTVLIATPLAAGKIEKVAIS